MSDNLNRLEAVFQQIIDSARGGDSTLRGGATPPAVVAPTPSAPAASPAPSVVVAEAPKKSGSSWIKYVAVFGLAVVVVVVVVVCLKRNSETPAVSGSVEFQPRALPRYGDMLQKSKTLQEERRTPEEKTPPQATPPRAGAAIPPTVTPEHTKLTEPPRPQHQQQAPPVNSDPNFTSIEQLVKEQTAGTGQ